MTRNCHPPETAPPDLVNSVEAPSFQATQAPTDSSIADLTGRQVAETPRRFHYSFQLVVRGVYDDNINLTQTQKSSDFYTSMDPTISTRLAAPAAGPPQAAP